MHYISRERKLFYNSIVGIIKQAVTVLSGFIIPRLLLFYYGSEANGLVSSITHFLSFIALMDLGVGSVIKANLYSPLATQDKRKVSLVFKSSSSFFRKVSFFILIYIIILLIVFRQLIHINNDGMYTTALIIIIALATYSQSFLGITNQLLLEADQCAYVPLALSIVTILLTTIQSIVMMRAGFSLQAVKLVSTLIYLIRPLFLYLYVKVKYQIDYTIKVEGEPIHQKWYGLAQHIASIVCQNVDVVVLSLFSTMNNVSIYSVYYLVISGVQQIVTTASTGVESFFGNIVSSENQERVFLFFSVVEWVFHFAVTILFTITCITIIPFIRIYTDGIGDANYIVPVFSRILVAAYFFMCLRIPYFRMIKAYGLFKETQAGSYLSAIVNIILTVILIPKLGLVGASIGTLIGMSYHTLYLVRYLSKHVLVAAKIRHFIRYLILDVLIICTSIFITGFVSIPIKGYLTWMLYAFIVGMITISISLIGNFVFCFDKMKNILVELKNK